MSFERDNTKSDILNQTFTVIIELFGIFMENKVVLELILILVQNLSIYGMF